MKDIFKTESNITIRPFDIIALDPKLRNYIPKPTKSETKTSLLGFPEYTRTFRYLLWTQTKMK